MNDAISRSASQRGAGTERRAPRTLAVDIGGTGIKAELLDERGRPQSERARIPTPKDATPRKVIAVVGKLARMRGGFDRVSVGFPGLVKNGVIYTAPNLGRGWNDFDLQRELRQVLKRPVRVANDADVQGLGAVAGRGIELVITLGTGFGSVIFVDGHRIHLELGHHPFRKGRTYEDELGHRALKKKGKARWNRRLREAIDDLKQAFNYDRLFIGGGNARHIRFEPPANVKIVSNEDGLLGGVKLWESEPAKPAQAAASVRTRPPAVSKSTEAAGKATSPAAEPVRAEGLPAAAVIARTAEAKAAVAVAKRTAAVKIAAAHTAARTSKAKIAAGTGRTHAAGADGPASTAGTNAPAPPAGTADPAPNPADAPGAVGGANGES